MLSDGVLPIIIIVVTSLYVYLLIKYVVQFGIKNFEIGSIYNGSNNWLNIGPLQAYTSILYILILALALHYFYYHAIKAGTISGSSNSGNTLILIIALSFMILFIELFHIIMLKIKGINLITDEIIFLCLIILILALSFIEAYRKRLGYSWKDYRVLATIVLCIVCIFSFMEATTLYYDDPHFLLFTGVYVFLACMLYVYYLPISLKKVKTHDDDKTLKSVIMWWRVLSTSTLFSILLWPQYIVEGQYYFNNNLLKTKDFFYKLLFPLMICLLSYTDYSDKTIITELPLPLLPLPLPETPLQNSVMMTGFPYRTSAPIY